MAAVLKHWREASTLILVTARQRGSNVKPNFVSSSAPAIKGANLEVLLLKRSSKSKFMPNLYVFPGGVATDVDFSVDWISVFDLLGRDHRQNLFDFVKRGGQGPPMFSRLRDQRFSQIPSEIAFRICAIRETFEESGVLIARKVGQGDHSFQPPLWDGPSWASYCEDQSIINEWRGRVDRDAGEFLRMCQELRMVPDVWSLYEWGNWLTPLRSKRRFDTSFFICCAQGKPDVAEDAGETVHSQWGAPHSTLSAYTDKEVSIAPPQLYEFLRLLRFEGPDDLLQFAWRRGQHRVERWLPVGVNTKDVILHCLPGDDFYPTDIDPENDTREFVHDATLAELVPTHPNCHRMQIHAQPDRVEGYTSHLECNIHLPGEQVTPINSIDYINSIKPKL